MIPCSSQVLFKIGKRYILDEESLKCIMSHYFKSMVNTVATIYLTKGGGIQGGR